MSSPADLANKHLVNRMIAEGSLWSAPLIAAFRATPRHRFLDRVFQYQRRNDRWRELITRNPGPDALRLIYSDRALITRLGRAPTGDGWVPVSSSSQPSLMALMLEDLGDCEKMGTGTGEGLHPLAFLRVGPEPVPIFSQSPGLHAGMRILEIGAGTGYNAALLAYVAGPGQVVSIDVDRAVLAEAWEHLHDFAERRVELKQADGRKGWAAGSPYDIIMVTAATPDLEPAWLEQIATQGLILAPLALAPALAFVVCGTVRDGVFHGRLTRAAYFMPLREGGAEDFSAEPQSLPLPARTMPAPWEGWFDRKSPRASWHGFIQALTFYGWLRGLQIHQRSLDDGQSLLGVSTGNGANACWLGSQEWQISGSAGHDLGCTLWRAFLDAGGPRPTEFRLTASSNGGLKLGPGESYLHQGPRCQQLWQLAEPRSRASWL